MLDAPPSREQYSDLSVRIVTAIVLGAIALFALWLGGGVFAVFAGAMTAEGRMSAVIVGGMPIVAGGAMYAMDPDHIGRLFEPGTGQTMLTIALGMMTVGMLVIYQMTKVKP